MGLDVYIDKWKSQKSIWGGRRVYTASNNVLVKITYANYIYRGGCETKASSKFRLQKGV